MADRRPDELPLPVLDELRALADLGVDHASDDEAAARVGARLRTPRRSRRGGARRTWRAIARRPLLLALVAVVGTGTAAAASFGLVGGPSAPLEGPLPAAAASDARVTADRYRIGLFPQIAIGEAGWCLSLTQTTDGRSQGGGMACGPAATTGTPLIAGMSGSVAGRPGAQLVASIVDRRVAGLRLHDGSVVRARADPALPDGWRSLVVFQERPRKSRYLGADGRAARAAYEAPRSPVPERLAFRTTDPASPARTCRIRSSDPGAARVTSARELRTLPGPTRGLNGRPFRSCATARVTHGGRTYTAAVLVDAQDPSSRAARLPGGRPRDASRVTVPGDIAREGIAARRVGRGWLLVQGSDASERRTVLEALRTGDGPALNPRAASAGSASRP
jgi:hypothetical protein